MLVCWYVDCSTLFRSLYMCPLVSPSVRQCFHRKWVSGTFAVVLEVPWDLYEIVRWSAGSLVCLSARPYQNKTQRSTMRPQATFSFFIFLQLFHFFTLLVAPSSSSLLPPRPSFLLVPPSSFVLFLPRPALPQSIKGHFSSILTKAQRTDGPTDGQGLL